MPTEMTNASGKVVWRGEENLWGEISHEISHFSANAVQQNLRFQGQYLDRETGLHYNLFRYYDPVARRFTQPDPIGLNGGINTYQYAPNALAWVDPLGLTKCGTGEYKYVGGHHIHAKAGFKSNPKYDPKKGFSISQDYMDKMGLDHQAMTSYQRQAFKELYNSGRPNTLAEHTKRAVNALESGGATTQQARSLVAESLWNLRAQGVISPSNIPWYK